MMVGTMGPKMMPAAITITVATVGPRPHTMPDSAATANAANTRMIARSPPAGRPSAFTPSAMASREAV